MDKYIKSIIEETFASKKQQRFFYAKANDKDLSKKERNKWKKWSKEYSSKTDFEDIPDKVESEVDEVVDQNGNIATKKIPLSRSSKGSTNKTTDEIVKTAAGSMGTHGVHGTHTSLRYWAESDMSKALGYENTLGQDKDMDDAEDYFEKELGMDDSEAEERLKSYGYDEKLGDDKVRLIENPKKYIQDYLESVISSKTKDNEILNKEEEIEVSEISPIVTKQISSLKQTLKRNNIPVSQVLKMLKDE